MTVRCIFWLEEEKSWSFANIRVYPDVLNIEDRFGREPRIPEEIHVEDVANMNWASSISLINKMKRPHINLRNAYAIILKNGMVVLLDMDSSSLKRHNLF